MSERKAEGGVLNTFHQPSGKTNKLQDYAHLAGGCSSPTFVILQVFNLIIKETKLAGLSKETSKLQDYAHLAGGCSSPDLVLLQVVILIIRENKLASLLLTESIKPPRPHSLRPRAVAWIYLFCCHSPRPLSPYFNAIVCCASWRRRKIR